MVSIFLLYFFIWSKTNQWLFFSHQFIYYILKPSRYLREMFLVWIKSLCFLIIKPKLIRLDPIICWHLKGLICFWWLLVQHMASGWWILERLLYEWSWYSRWCWRCLIGENRNYWCLRLGLLEQWLVYSGLLSWHICVLLFYRLVFWLLSLFRLWLCWKLGGIGGLLRPLGFHFCRWWDVVLFWKLRFWNRL